MSACNLRLLQREEKIESRDEKELCRRVTLLVRWYTAHTLTLKLRKDLNALLHTHPDANTGVLAFSHVHAHAQSDTYSLRRFLPLSHPHGSSWMTFCSHDTYYPAYITWDPVEEGQMNTIRRKEKQLNSDSVIWTKPKRGFLTIRGLHYSWYRLVKFLCVRLRCSYYWPAPCSENRMISSGFLNKQPSLLVSNSNVAQ